LNLVQDLKRNQKYSWELDWKKERNLCIVESSTWLKIWKEFLLKNIVIVFINAPRNWNWKKMWMKN
jgi:hypothetical protein